MQLETTAYVGVKSRAHVGYLLLIFSSGMSGRCRFSEMGTNDTRPAINQMTTMVVTATRLVTQRPYLWSDYYYELSFCTG